jgi:hypothetical protein
MGFSMTTRGFEGHSADTIETLTELAREHGLTLTELVQIIAERAEAGQSWPGRETSRGNTGMEESTAPAGSRDRCLVILTVGGKTVIDDILVSGLDNEVLKAEALSGWDAEAVALHRGTSKGMEMMMAACLMHSNRGDNYEAMLVTLWGFAHSPIGDGWIALRVCL